MVVTAVFINFGRVRDKSFKEWRQKIGRWKGVWQQYFDFFVPLYSIKMSISCLFLNAFTHSFDKRNLLHAFDTWSYDFSL